MILNTELCIDLKTKLQSDKIMLTGKHYQGTLLRDISQDGSFGDHFTFTENKSSSQSKRNPRVFNGKFITVTRSSDGNLRPNFKPLKLGPDFNAATYATNVANELLWALTGLLGK